MVAFFRAWHKSSQHIANNVLKSETLTVYVRLHWL